VVSIALLGYGASGSFLFSFPTLLSSNPHKRLLWASWLFSGTTVAAYVLSNHIPFDMARLSWDRGQILFIFLYDLVWTVPFFFSGVTLTTAFRQWSPWAGKLYFFDLAGAALGCLLVLLLLTLFGGPGALWFAAILAGLASIAFGGFPKGLTFFRCAWMGFLLLILFWQPPFLEQRLSPYKALNVALLFPGARLLDTRWNAFSRVDVLTSPAARTAPGLSLIYTKPLPLQLGLTVDADHLSAITHYPETSAGQGELQFLDFLPSSFPYQLIQPRRVLILHPMGGLDVLTALRYQAEKIVVIEDNPTLVELLQGKYGEYSGGIYLKEKTYVEVGEGRNYLRRAPPAFDLIILPLTESLGASSMGLMGLTEDYRLTTEAFQEYFRALKPGGWLAISLYLLPPPRGELRLVATAKKVLEQAGKRPGEHILAFRSWGTFSLCLKKESIIFREISTLKSFCARMRFDLVHYPGMNMKEANIYNRFPTPLYFRGVEKVLNEGEKFYSDYLFDITPAADDRPFFHYYFRWSHLRELYRLAGEKWQFFIEGGTLVPVVLLQAILLSVLFLLLPFITGGRKKEVPKASPVQTFSWLVYFSLLGLGFMFVEISLIQKFILFLNHPVYAVSLVIFSLLVFAGIGSRLSLRLNPRTSWFGKFALLWIAALLGLHTFLLPGILLFFQGAPLYYRQALTILAIAPLGFLMGMPFPMGLRLLGSQDSALIPWAWCANGCFSVLGSILPVVIALSWGFRAVFLLASFLYILNFFLIRKSY
jgi:spermidine synthase